MIRGKKKKKRRKKKEEVIFRLTKKFGNLVSYQRSELSALDSRASSVQRERGRGRERERERERRCISGTGGKSFIFKSPEIIWPV